MKESPQSGPPQSGPMLVGDGIRAGIAGAFRLAQGHADGLASIARDPDAARTGCWAVVLCLPAMLVLRLSAMPSTDAGLTAHDILSPTLLYVVGWAGYALLSRQIATAMGRQVRWPLFFAAWNWCNLVQYALFLVASVPGWAGAPDWLGQVLTLVALCWALWLQWFATRLALDVGRWRAVLLVVVDVLVGVFLAS